MTGQEALIPGAAGPHVWRRFIEDDSINHAQWMRACSEGAFIGECRCGGYLVPRRPEQLAGRTDYTATCRSCETEICAPGGRLNTGRRRPSTKAAPDTRSGATHHEGV